MMKGFSLPYWMADVGTAFTLALTLLFAVGVYVLVGLALYRMAERLGIENAWLGFIPVASVWLLGKIADASEPAPKHANRLLLLELLSIALSVIFAVIARVVGGVLAASVMLAASVLSIVLTVFTCIALYRICLDFDVANAILWFLGIVIGGFLCTPICAAILLFLLSGKEPRSAAPRATYTEVPPRDVQ